MPFSIPNSFSNVFSAFQIVRPKPVLGSYDFTYLSLTPQSHLLTLVMGREFWGPAPTTLERHGMRGSTSREQQILGAENHITLWLLLFWHLKAWADWAGPESSISLPNGEPQEVISDGA